MTKPRSRFKTALAAMLFALAAMSGLVATPALAQEAAPTEETAPAEEAGQVAEASGTDAEPAAEPETPVDHPLATIVVDVETGKVLSRQNATERRYPASTTKLMTAYLALKALRAETVALDSPVIVTRQAADEPPSKMDYKPGSVIRLDNALRMMLVKSANDVAVAIGQSLAGGSLGDFVDMMNAEAKRLGMEDTRFINPNGLPGEGQYSTAKDLAILGMTIRREFPAFSEFFGTEAISNGKSLMKNGNKLLGRFEGADGMKTGYICASGFNLVSSATRDGRTLIAVVLGANGTIERERNSAEILQAGFQADLDEVTETVTDLPASSGEPLDTSDYICSQEGRTERANDRVAEKEREEVFGSPYLTELNRAPVTVNVGLGGAAGNDEVAPGVSIIANYGIPIPTPRPTPPPANDNLAAGEDATDPAADETTEPAAPDTAPADPAAEGARPAEPANEESRLGPSTTGRGDVAAAANAYAGGDRDTVFPRGIESPLARKGPRLDIDFKLRTSHAAGDARQGAAN